MKEISILSVSQNGCFFESFFDRARKDEEK